MKRARAILAGASVLVAGCGGSDDPVVEAPWPQASVQPPPQSSSPARWPTVKPYEPDAAETYANGKRLASLVTLRAITYPRGASAAQVADRIPFTTVSGRSLAAAIEPVVDPGVASSGEIVYPQLAGVTPTSLGAMVVVRQRLRNADGDSRAVTRVFDVRLTRSGGPWRLERIASVGGLEAGRPSNLSDAARGVADNPRIRLSDSARWDIYRGDVDEGLLEALRRLAGRHRIAVSVISSGHPENVWRTDRRSAHSRGYAADIYEIDGRLVVRQQAPGSQAHSAAGYLVAEGAAQVGSPWLLGRGGRRSFADVVHEDHVHVQWSKLDGDD